MSYKRDKIYRRTAIFIYLSITYLASVAHISIVGKAWTYDSICTGRPAKLTVQRYTFWQNFWSEYSQWSQGSSVSTETRLWAVHPGFNLWQVQWWDFSFFTTVSKLTLGPTKPPIQCVRGGGVSPGVSGPGVKLTTHLHLASTNIRNVWQHTCTFPIHLHGVVLN
jgi:hypothetical protein